MQSNCNLGGELWSNLERPEGYQQSLEDIVVQEYCKWAKQNDFGRISSKQIEVVREIVFAFLTAEEGKVTVIPPMMGLGKSTILFIYFKVQNALNQGYGAIVVKERVDDVKAFSNQIGYVDDEYGEQKISYPWQGFSDDLCILGHSSYELLRCVRCSENQCEVKTAHADQIYYPIVTMTHERLFLKANQNKTFEDLSIWKDQYGKERQRKYLIIDEKPKFFSTVTIKEEDIKTFVGMVKRLETIVKMNLESVRLEENLRNSFTCIGPGSAKLIQDTESKRMIGIIEKYWWKKLIDYSDEELSLITKFGHLCSNNVYRGKDNKANILTVGISANFSIPGYCTIILDGTAVGDMTYPKDAKIIEIADYRRYNKVTIWHNSKRNLSKSYLHRNADVVFSELAEEIVKISTNSKTLVVCSKQFEEKLKSLLPESGNIVVAHFNSIKGSNDYLDCTSLFFAGTIDFGDDYYILKALAIDPEQVTSLDTKNDDSKHIFNCDYINEVERNDKEKYILQDLFRVAVRDANNTKQIDTYLFQTDEKLIQNISKCLPGCTIKDWIPMSYRKRIAPVETSFIEYLQKKLQFCGDKVTKKQIEDDLALRKDYRIELSKKEYVVQTLKDSGIEEYTRGWMKVKQ